MLIEVKQEHIDKGMKRHCSLCPVALAVIDKIKPDIECRVGARSILFGTSTTYASIMLQLGVVSWIHRFDATGVGEPFSFELDIPEQFLC